jgi:hypothetical protein
MPKNLKGFVFTLDAIFSLIFATGAVALLVYVNYTTPGPLSAPASYASSVLQSLSRSSISTVANGSLDLQELAGSAPVQYVWPQYGRDEGLSSGGPYGQAPPLLLYSFTAPTDIIPVPVVGSGVVAFAAGDLIYALNATTGAPISNYPAVSPTPIVSSPLIYSKSIIYANSIGAITALSITNGLSVLWSTPPPNSYKRTTTPLEIEDNYLVFADLIANTPPYSNIILLNPVNGTMVEQDSTAGSGGPSVSWISYFRGNFHVGHTGSGSEPFNLTIDHASTFNYSSANTPVFAAGGNYVYAPVRQPYNGLDYTIVPSGGATAATYNTTALLYSRSGDYVAIYDQQGYPATLTELLPAMSSNFNTTPSVGGSAAYLLLNGTNFESYSYSGLKYNVTLPNDPYDYNYSSIALGYGNAYVPDGQTLYVFGVRQQQANESLLTALGNMYLNGEGGLADAVLYNFYNSSNIGIYINNTYAPSLNVSEFNGATSVVAIPAHASLSPQADGNHAIGLCAWYKINNLPYAGLITKGWSGPSAGDAPEFAIDPNGAYQGFELFSSTGSPVASADAAAITSNSLGRWYFSCFTYNQSASSASYYLDAVPYAASGGVAGLPSTSSGKLVFGTGVTGPGATGYSNVAIADVQLYNSSLTPQQVRDLYSRGMYGMPLAGHSLVGWWPLLGDANDYSGRGNDGFASGVVYANVGALPDYVSNAYRTDKATLPVRLSNNGIYRNYNVSVVLWAG